MQRDWGSPPGATSAQLGRRGGVLVGGEDRARSPSTQGAPQTPPAATTVTSPVARVDRDEVEAVCAGPRRATSVLRPGASGPRRSLRRHRVSGGSPLPSRRRGGARTNPSAPRRIAIVRAVGRPVERVSRIAGRARSARGPRRSRRRRRGSRTGCSRCAGRTRTRRRGRRARRSRPARRRAGVETRRDPDVRAAVATARSTVDDGERDRSVRARPRRRDGRCRARPGCPPRRAAAAGRRRPRRPDPAAVGVRDRGAVGREDAARVLPVRLRVAARRERGAGRRPVEIEQPDVGRVAILDEHDRAAVRSEGRRPRPLGRHDRLEPPVRRRLQVDSRGWDAELPRRSSFRSRRERFRHAFDPSSSPSKVAQHEPPDRGEIVAALLYDDDGSPWLATISARLADSPRCVTCNGLSGSARCGIDAEREHERLDPVVARRLGDLGHGRAATPRPPPPAAAAC